MLYYTIKVEILKFWSVSHVDHKAIPTVKILNFKSKYIKTMRCNNEEFFII